jgi:hypothetical protein
MAKKKHPWRTFNPGWMKPLPLRLGAGATMGIKAVRS